MKRFTTPCFVRVEDAGEREELLQWCIAIGYLCPVIPKEEIFGEVIICDGECVGIVHDPTAFSAITTYKDCGTDIELFKALAAMNNENDYMQWFIIGKGDVKDWFVRCDYHSIQDHPDYASFALMGYGRATAEEIIEHFKNK
jgi:hypothetical protein